MNKRRLKGERIRRINQDDGNDEGCGGTRTTHDLGDTMMRETRCFNCGEFFEYNKNDLRPYLYHDCRDGCSAGMRNPNFWEKQPRQWIPPPKTKEQVLNMRLKDFYGGDKWQMQDLHQN